MHRRILLGARLVTPIVLGWAGLHLFPETLRAQEPQERILVTGRVVDRTTAGPLAGAFVRPPPPFRGSLTDESGRFQLSLPPGEDQTLQIERLGYAPLEFTLSAAEMGMNLRIELDPQAILLEGIEVFSESLSERFERRRNAAVGLIEAYRTPAILESGARDGFEFFDRVFRMGRPCSGQPGWCARTPRGEVLIRACIDGMPAWGGVEELRDYAPEEFYLIEVNPFGRFVRAYTWEWVRSGFRRAMVQMDPIVRANPDAPRSAAFDTFQEAFARCG